MYAPRPFGYYPAELLSCPLTLTQVSFCHCNNFLCHSQGVMCECGSRSTEQHSTRPLFTGNSVCDRCKCRAKVQPTYLKGGVTGMHFLRLGQKKARALSRPQQQTPAYLKGSPAGSRSKARQAKNIPPSGPTDCCLTPRTLIYGHTYGPRHRLLHYIWLAMTSRPARIGPSRHSGPYDDGCYQSPGYVWSTWHTRPYAL